MAISFAGNALNNDVVNFHPSLEICPVAILPKPIGINKYCNPLPA
jgi:hypothetical protein